MSIFSRFFAVAGLLVLAACGGSGGAQGSGTTANWNLTDVSVRFGPDISRTASGRDFGSNFVWNGYSDGNRKQQVIGLFRQALTELGDQVMTGPVPVRMNVQVNYFHALTDFSRLWCCGEHRIYADLAIVDAVSGATLASGEDVYLGRMALGGIPGLMAVASGRDQDVRIREGIQEGTLDWLSQF